MANIKRIIDAIDFEISNINQKQRRPGWSLWALWSALAVIIWLFSSNLSDLILFPIYLILPIFLIYDSIFLFIILIQSNGHSNINGTRFRYSHRSFSNRIPLFIRSGRYGFLIFLLMNSSMPWQHYLLWPYLALMLTASLMLILLSYIKVPINISGSPYRVQFKVLSFLLGVVTLIVATSLLGLLESHPSMLELQLICLIVAAYIIIIHVTEQDSPPFMLNSLIELRRDLALDRIALEDASSQFDKIILGLETSDIIQQQYSSVLGLIEDVKRIFKTLSDELAARDEVEAKDKPDSKDRILQDALSTSITANLINACDTVVQVKKAIEQYNKRKIQLRFAGNEAVNYLVELDENIKKDVEDMSRILADLMEQGSVTPEE